MVHNKKKYHCGLLTFSLLCCLFLIFNVSECFASMSSDYLDYGVNLLKDNFVGTNSSRTQIYKNSLNLLTSNDKNNILTAVNSYMSEYGISALDDINIFITINEINDYHYYLRFFFCNNGAPNGINNLSHFLLSRNQIVCYNSQPGYIYTFRQEVYLNGNYNVLGETLKGKFDKTSFSSINYTTFSFNENNTVLTINNFVCAGIPTGFCYYPLTSTSTIIPIILKDVNGNYQIITPEPDEPSGDISSTTGTITNNSGDKTGQIDLTGIENGITDLNNNIIVQGQNITNQISGDTQKILDSLSTVPDMSQTEIDSSDIMDSIGVTLIENPYTNFWTTLLNGFRDCLTQHNRTLNVEFRGNLYQVNLDDFSVFLPDSLKVFLSTISTVAVVIFITKNAKHITQDIQTASIDNVADNLTEDFESNMF